MRYCAYLDILGFRELIENLRNQPDNLETLRSLLKEVHNPGKFSFYLENGSDLRSQSISDAVAISAALNSFGLAHLAHVLVDIADNLIRRGYFVRGAIVKGLLYHDDEMVFGEALVRAYTLEQEVVRYPRVMITRDVASDMKSYRSGLLDRVVIQSADGPFFVDVLLHFVDEAADVAEKKLSAKDDEECDEARWALDYLLRVRERLENRFLAAVDNPRHFEKVQWFVAYWNRSVGAANGELRIEGPGVLPETAVWG